MAGPVPMGFMDAQIDLGIAGGKRDGRPGGLETTVDRAGRG